MLGRSTRNLCILHSKLFNVIKSRFYSKSSHLSCKIPDGPSLSYFIENTASNSLKHESDFENIPYLQSTFNEHLGRKIYMETYGCQMNVNDTEIVFAILKNAGFEISKNIAEADVIFVMTCAIREGAEQKIWRRLENFKALKKKRSSKQSPLQIGILGCIAERLKHKLLEKEKMVDIVAGPDSYKDLPNLLSLASSGQKAVNVILSADETYADILPVRISPESKTAFVSIMRGCDNMCTYCIVPFTRGRERSRPVSSILDEVKHLSDEGYKEVTLLGQNVNSYRDLTNCSENYHPEKLSDGFSTIYGPRISGLNFADLLHRVAEINPEMRVRFTSPHPKDFPDPVLQVIRDYPNVCKLIHLPAQSGNSEILEKMRRGYTVEAYLQLVEHIKNMIPDVAFTSDFISGFCGETEEAHQDSLTLLEKVKYEFAYVFPYSMRNKTTAYHKLIDDVPEDVKKRRADELHTVFRKYALERHIKEIGTEHLVLAINPSKKSNADWSGRNDWNTKVIFPYESIPNYFGSQTLGPIKTGDYVVVKITDCSSQVLKGIALYHTTLQEYERKKRNQSNLCRNFACIT